MRRKRILWMMCLSSALLLLFIGRWLQTAYNSEKTELSKDLFSQFMSARSRLTDSLIAKHFITPILADSGKVNIETIEALPPAGITDSTRMIRMNRMQDTSALEIRINCDSCPGDPEQFTYSLDTDSSDLIYKGVKMLIHEVHGRSGESLFYRRFTKDSDTLLLQQYFAENLKAGHLNVTPVWVKGGEEDTFPPPLFHYESRLFSIPMSAEIHDYNRYILREMLPEILFSLLLLSVTAISFFIAYKSYREQVLLALMKDDLISNISHELKTPVATIKVAIEAMREMDPAEKKDKIRDYLSMSAQEVERLEILVNKVMNTVLMESGREVFHDIVFDLREIIQETTTRMQAVVNQHGGSIRLEMPESPMEIIADAFHIRSIFYNLIDNSIKYGGNEVEIMIQVEKRDGQVFVHFSDNGPGIPKMYRHKVFEKFFRMPEGHQHNTKGYGLGLYYAAQVMEHSKGSIRVEDTTGKGCTFILQFPAA